jgi:hypothetical protein
MRQSPRSPPSPPQVTDADSKASYGVPEPKEDEDEDLDGGGGRSGKYFIYFGEEWGWRPC